MKNCTKCELDKDLTQFGNNKNAKDGKQRYCKTCQAESDHNHYINNKNEAYSKRKCFSEKSQNYYLEFRKNNICAKCEDDRHYVLEFHHLDPSTKKFNLGNSSKKGINSIKEELKKCIPLCASCHREFHYFEKHQNINIQQYLIM